jgi:hypothetical protein
MSWMRIRSARLFGNGRHVINLAIGLAAVASFLLFGSRNDALQHSYSIKPQLTRTTVVGPHVAFPSLQRSGESAVISTTARPNPFFNMRDFRREFSEAKNYWTLAQSLLPAADAGEPGAQYYLSKAIGYCAQFYEPFFTSSDTAQSSDIPVASGFPAILAQTVFERCHDLQDQIHRSPVPISADDWLESAAANGQRLASIDIAARTLSQSRALENAPDDAVTDYQKIYYAPNPLSVLRDALASGDPDVLFAMSSVPVKAAQSPTNQLVDSMAWRLVACQRGFDCSATADWVVIACQVDTSCVPGESGLDVVRATAGSEVDQVESRAAEISAQLNSNDWNQLVPEDP